MLPYKNTVFCVVSCEFIKSTCWTLCSENCPSTNRENYAFRRLKSCVNWHLAAGCSTSLILIWQPLYLTHQQPKQLNMWPDATNFSSCDDCLAKQGENVPRAPASQRTIQEKTWTELCEGWAKLWLLRAGISRGAGSVSCSRRGAEDKTLMGYDPQITSGRMRQLCWTYRAMEGELPEDQQDSSAVFMLVMLPNSAGVIPPTKLPWSVSGSASRSLID